MAKKKIKIDDLISLYMEHLLEHGSRPNSVFIFAKTNNFEEAAFYQFFGNFEALEQSIFRAFFDNAHSMLEKSDDYQSYDNRNKLLSFYFTFFEILTANRSYVVHALESNKNQLKNMKSLSELKKAFTSFIDSLEIETLDVKQEQLEKIQKRSLQESAWLQLLITMKFWLDDSSPSFEKTDIFIEKSVNTSFDLLDTTPLKSMIDFGKFIFKEKIHMS